MSIRYIYNTSGKYVAFIQGDNLFSPDADWIGFSTNGVDFYNTDGTHLGKLLGDDRIARQTNITLPRILPPFPPFRPFRPFAPYPRLRMPSLPYGWKDVFENGITEKAYSKKVENYDYLKGSDLFAHDGKFLGAVTKNSYDSKSMGNRFGPHGNRYGSDSIFNPYSPYGSKYSYLSPFSQHSITPPRFVRNGKTLGYLTVNARLQNHINPDDFFLWFENM